MFDQGGEFLTDRFNSSELMPFDSNPEIYPGSLLIATESISDTPFYQAVILILQSNKAGTIGVTLNQPANDEIKLAWQQLPGQRCDDRFLVRGGPIDGPVFAIHQNHHLGEIEMPGGIFVTAQANKFKELANLKNTPYRIAFGIVGWKPGQLQSEVNHGLWYCSDSSNADQIFCDPGNLWEEAMERHGSNILHDILSKTNFKFPNTPLDN